MIAAVALVCGTVLAVAGVAWQQPGLVALGAGLLGSPGIAQALQGSKENEE